MNKQNIFFLLLCFPLLIFSCDILRDSPYEVQAWTPGEGFHNSPEKLKISILLSHASDKAKTEQAFSLTEDGKTLRGYFSWEGLRLVFTPASPLEKDRDYFITLGTGAQDTKGLSLEHSFEASFTTRIQGGKPRIIRTEPEHGGSLSESREEFRLFFSEPISLNSCIDYISFSPSTPGSWRLENGNKTAIFVPRDGWLRGSSYQVNVESSFTGGSGLALGTDYSSNFYASADREKPVLLRALALSPAGKEEEISLTTHGQFGWSGTTGSSAEYSAWERFTRLCLVFSKPVDLSNLGNLIVIEPSLSLVMESPPLVASQVIFRFAEYPVWGNVFHFRLNSGVKDQAGNESVETYSFRIRAGGPLSKPPVLVGIRLPMSPGNSGNYEALSFSPGDLFADLPIKDGEERYPFNKQTPAWIELYFETAPESAAETNNQYSPSGTEIDLFSIMDLFRVESTNQSLVFSPRSVKTNGFTLAAPSEGWETYQRIEIQGLLTNTVHSGIVTFRVPPGLRDKRGNISDVDFRVSLLK